eukprot:3325962-Prymnesium_polylepis.1
MSKVLYSTLLEYTLCGGSITFSPTLTPLTKRSNAPTPDTNARARDTVPLGRCSPPSGEVRSFPPPPIHAAEPGKTEVAGAVSKLLSLHPQSDGWSGWLESQALTRKECVTPESSTVGTTRCCAALATLPLDHASSLACGVTCIS